MKCLYIVIALSVSPVLMGMEKPPQAAQKKEHKPYVFDKKTKDCAICLDKMNPGQSYTCFPCQHAMHYECFQKFAMSSTKNNCPECRSNLSNQVLASLQEKPSGTIIKDEPDKQKAGFFSSIFDAVIGSGEPDLVSADQKIKSLTEALSEAQKNAAAAQDQVGKLITQKSALQNELKKIDAEYHKFRLFNPQLVHLESYKKNLEEIASKNTELERALIVANDRVFILLREKREFEQQRAALQASFDNKQELLMQQIDSHDALRRRIANVTTLGAGIGSGILAANYIKSCPKLAGIMTGAGVLAATYWAGSKYCDSCYLQDRRNAN